MWRAWGGGGAHSLEPRQTSGDLRHDGIPSPLGAAAELARDGAGISNQLGIGVSLGGVVGAVGPDPPQIARDGIAGRGRDSLGPRFAGRQLPDGHLSDRRALPAIALGRATTVAGHAAAGPARFGARGWVRAAFRVQRHVEALPASHRDRSRASAARVGSFPYHHAFEPGGGSGPPRRERTPAGSEPAARAETEAHALAAAAPGQPGPWTGPTKARRPTGQQAGHGSRLGVEGNLLPLLALQIRDLGWSFS